MCGHVTTWCGEQVEMDANEQVDANQLLLYGE